MDNILSWCILSYILIYLYYTSAALYALSYILSYIYIYYTAPHILHHSYILFYYILLYTYYIFLYILSTLLFSNNIINLAPRRFTPLSYNLFSLSCILATFIFLYSHIVIPTLLYRKGITTLPPIFTRFTSLS